MSAAKVPTPDELKKRLAARKGIEQKLDASLATLELFETRVAKMAKAQLAYRKLFKTLPKK